MISIDKGARDTLHDEEQILSDKLDSGLCLQIL